MPTVARFGPRKFSFSPTSVDVLQGNGSPATLYDASGTTASPVVIDAEGAVSFYAAPGAYRLRLNRASGEPTVLSTTLDAATATNGGTNGGTSGGTAPAGSGATLLSTFKGAYSGTAAYEVGDVVTHLGSTYLAAAAQVAPSAGGFSDDFNRTTTGPGNGWTLQAGNVSCNGSQVVAGANESGIYGSAIIRDLGVSSGSFTCVPAVHPAGLWLRAAGTGVASTGIAVRTDGVAYAFRGNGLFTNLASFTANAGQALRVDISGDNYTVYANGVQVATFTSTLNSTSTAHGVHFANGGAVDSFQQSNAVTPHAFNEAKWTVLAAGLASSTSPWTTATLAGTARNYSEQAGNDTSHAAASFYRGPDSVVLVRGVVQNYTAGTTLFTLPEDCRPDKTVIAACIGTNNAAFRVTVTAAGEVSAATTVGTGGGDFLALNLTFRAAV